jgi:hypothetical protein
LPLVVLEHAANAAQPARAATAPRNLTAHSVPG